MTILTRRFIRFPLSFIAATGLLLSPAWARTPAKNAKPVAAAAKTDATPWLYKGSDIPPDPAWTFGSLPNGLRYAVRKNGVPPGQASIRVGIDAGALHESDSEQGFAHFIEHLSFRGSKHVTDGEAKRVWQRLGASFGSDTNAVTSHTQTIYKLDLPDATETGLDESLKILSGMMESPTITPAEVDAERRTILAEQREQFGPSVKMFDATRALFFHGQLFGRRSPIGTAATLEGASSASLRAFHDRWYRPEKAIVIINGDGDPALYARLIARHFSAWKGKGPAVADPDFGKPDPAAPTTSVIVEPGVPLGVSMAIFRPWVQKDDTIAYNQAKLMDIVALRIVNRRLEQRARAGASYLQAQIDQEDIARSADGTLISIMPLGTDWKKALEDVRGVIADALERPATMEEIDRESGEFFSALQVAVETERTESAAKQADDILSAVAIRETVATAQVAADVFGGIKGKISPETVKASLRRLLTGTPQRALLTTPIAIPDAKAQLTAALAAPVVAQTGPKTQGAVSFAQLPKLGPPGTVTESSPITGLDMEVVTFSNGTKAVLFLNPAESGKIYVQARFGNGRQAFAANKANLIWTGGAMLVASGIGPFNEDALDRLTSGRVINMSFDVTDSAFALRGNTRAADLADQLLLMAHQLANPRWDAAPIARMKAGMLASYDSSDASAQTVLGKEMGRLLNGGDARWTTPSKAQVAALSAEAFRKTWEPLLKQGQIELLVFGDGKRDEVIAAIAASLGALPKRKDAPVPASQAGSRGPVATATPTELRHKGPADQAAALVAYPTGGGLDRVFESRKLEVLSAIFNDRMFERFREAEGQSYSPSVSNNWPMSMPRGGSFFIVAQPKPEGTKRFFAIVDEIAADLAARPPTQDEFSRAVGPTIESINRASSGNSFWLSQLAGLTRESGKVPALRSLIVDFRRITPGDIQAMAREWLVASRAMRVSVVPENSITTASGR